MTVDAARVFEVAGVLAMLCAAAMTVVRRPVLRPIPVRVRGRR